MAAAAAVGGERMAGKETCLVQSADSDAERLRILHAWAAKRHVWIHEDVVVGEMPQDDNAEEIEGADETIKTSASPPEERHTDQRARGRGYGVYVKAGHGALEERQVLVLVPKMAILSPRTSSMAQYLDMSTFFGHDAASGLILSLVLLHEFLVGPKGPWWGFLQSLPRQHLVEGQERWGVSLPMHWERDCEAWRWIEWAEAGRIVQRAHEDPMGRIEGIGMSCLRLRAFFKSTALPLLRKAHREFFNDTPGCESNLLKDFIGIHSIISSRAFVVDMFHGQALVPVSDMFNHSDDANVHFEADDEVCDECGALGSCEHNDDPLPSAAYGRPSAFLPAAFGPNSVDWKPPAALEGVDTVDMVAQEHIAPGREAFNTYGLMSNAILLTSYGFALEEETEWERSAWEWRNTGERNEVKAALRIGDTKKRSREGSAEESNDASDRYTEQFEKLTPHPYDVWVNCCITFSRLMPSSFDELRQDPIEVMGRRRSFATADEMPTLTMPVRSPFVALTRSVEETGDEMDETELSESMQDAFVALSTHDGSRDGQQPFFVDATGRISWALWRATVLAAFAAQSSEGTLLEKQIASMLQRVEALLQDVIAASENAEKRERKMETVEVAQLLDSTLEQLEQLIQARLDQQYISRPHGQSDALRIIEVRIAPIRPCYML